MKTRFMRLPRRWLLRITNLWKKRFGVPPLGDSIADMTDWFTTPLGDALVQEERRVINESLSCVFGYHLMQLGISGEIDMGENVRISHRFILHPQPTDTTPCSALADFNHLPLANDSLDAVILHHALDYTQSPHHLLREAARVIIPRGHLVIFGFNPWSFWGLGSQIGRLCSPRPCWRYQYLRLGRLLDWLKLVDLEPVQIYRGFYRPPLPQPKAIKHLQWMEAWGKRLRWPGGGFYMIVARKDHLAMIPAKPLWQPVKPLAGLAVPALLGRRGRTLPVDLPVNGPRHAARSSADTAAAGRQPSSHNTDAGLDGNSSFEKRRDIH